MEGHICRQNMLIFALVFCFELSARAARTCCHCHLAVKNPIHDGNQGKLKLPKSHERYHNVWSCDIELCTNGVEASKGWVFIAHFSIYSSSRCHCHAGTDILRLRGHTLQISQVVRTVRHWISCCTLTVGNVMRKCKIGKSSPHQPCENVLELSSLLWMARALVCF